MEENNIGKNLNTFRRNQHFCDVTLLVEHERFPCHRAILAQGCSYFYAMLTNFKEKSSDEIILEGLSSKGFEDILNFVYESKVNINRDNFKYLLIASDMLGMGNLQAICEKFMRDADVLVDMIDLFIYYADINNAKLAKKLKRVICEKFSDICDSGSVVDLNYEGLKSILKCKFLTARKEETVFDGVFKWIKFDKESRLNYMEELLSLIKVPSLTSPYMTDLLMNEPILQDKKYRDMVVKSGFSGLYKTYKKPKLELHEPGFMLFSRKFPDDTNFTPEVFRKNRFVQNLDELSFETSYLRSVILDKNMLFVLSKDNARKLKFQRINLNTNEIMDLKAPPGKPRYYTLKTDGSRIYLYAQSAFYNPRTKFFAYDLQQDIWIKIPDLTINDCHIGNSCFTVHQNKLYSIGGNLKESDRINNVYSFDTRGCDWIPLPAMNQARSRASACFVNENLCVSGGGSSNSIIEVLDFSMCIWNSISYSLPTQKSILSMYCASNKLYFINGKYEKLRRYVRDVDITCTDISKFKFDGAAVQHFHFPNEVWKSVNIYRDSIVDTLLFDS